MKSILKLAFILTLVIAINSCKKDSDIGPKATAKTNATISLKDSKGPVSNMTVYVFKEDTWKMMGNDPFFATGEAASDTKGNAVFSNLEYLNVFTSLNNNLNTMRFSVHYSKNGVNKTKFIAITIEKGESKTGTLFLD